MDKEVVSTLTIQELSMFPLDDFFDHYEKGLRKVNRLGSLLEEVTRHSDVDRIKPIRLVMCVAVSVFIDFWENMEDINVSLLTVVLFEHIIVVICKEVSLYVDPRHTHTRTHTHCAQTTQTRTHTARKRHSRTTHTHTH